jgi:thiamine-monophosphate kinase
MKIFAKSEFEFIETIRRRYSLQKIGDDCAVLPKDSKTDLVITTDLLVEDIDFKLEWTTPEFVGHKSLAVSLSDVAAMGAKPFGRCSRSAFPKKFGKPISSKDFMTAISALLENLWLK